MENYFIRVAEDSDESEIQDFTVRHFSTRNPLEMAHPDKSDPHEIDSFFADAIKSKFVLMAIESSTQKLIGVLIAEPADPSSLEELKTIAASPGNQKRTDILNFLIYVEEKANIFQRFDVKEVLYIHIVGVHPDHTRQQIARKLFETSIDSARSRKYKLVCTDCTSLYSAKVAASVGMEHVSTVTYDEYNNYLGTNLFTPVQPHTEIKSFVKKF